MQFNVYLATRSASLVHNGLFKQIFRTYASAGLGLWVCYNFRLSTIFIL